MKKLLLESGNKTAFCDNIFYQQCAGVLKFYCRYVNDMLVLVKED